MRDHLGFTLIETLIATLVLVSGLVAVAAIFLYSVDTGLRNQRRTAATALLYEKMEQFRSAPVNDSIWIPGGSLNVASPAAGYFDYVTIDATGTLSHSTTDTNAPFMRVWQVPHAVPPSVTVAVYTFKAGSIPRSLESTPAPAAAPSSFRQPWLHPLQCAQPHKRKYAPTFEGFFLG